MLAGSGCDSDPLSKSDAGIGVDTRADAGTPDGSAVDAAAEDAAASDAGVTPCDPLASASSPEAFAHIEGLISVLEFYSYDASRAETFHWRQWQIGAFSAPMEPTTTEPYLYAGIAPDSCVTLDIPHATRMLAPFRNFGTRLDWAAASGDRVTWARETDEYGTFYRLPSGPIGLRFSDPAQTPFNQRWTWSTPGDLGGLIAPASAEILPVEDFEVTPPISRSEIPLVLSPELELRWTAPVVTPAVVSLVMARATSPEGDARAVICRPIDDGAFAISQRMIDDLGAAPGSSFSFDLSRSQTAPFCNEGIREGIAVHTIAHLGAAVIR